MKSELKKILNDTEHGSVDLALQFLRLIQKVIEQESNAHHTLLEWLDLMTRHRGLMAVFHYLSRELRPLLLQNVDPSRILEKINQLEQSLLYAHESMIPHALNLIMKYPGPAAFYSRSSILKRFAHALAERKFNDSLYLAQARHHDEGIPFARELRKLNLSVFLFTDPLFYNRIEQCGSVWVSCDFATPDGFANKTGTRPLAILARSCGVPMFVFVTKEKFVSGDMANRLIQRTRQIDRVETYGDIDLFGSDLDFTPWHQITAIITPGGVFSPEKGVSWLST